MNRLLTVVSLMLLSLYSLGQVNPANALQSDRVSALKVLTVRDKRIDSVSTDTSLAGNRNTVISSQAALKEYIRKRQNYNRPIYGKGLVIAINDSTVALRGDTTGTDSPAFYGRNGSNQYGLWPFPVGSSGGVGDTTYAIKMTMAQFDAATGLPTTGAFVEITDSLRRGRFAYETNVANQTTDNDGTVKVTADGQRWRRIYEGPIRPEWFGLLPGTGHESTNVAAVRAAQAAARDWEEIHIGAIGKVYFNDALTFASTGSKHSFFVCDAPTFFSSGTGFIVADPNPQIFITRGRISGPNAQATDSIGYANYIPGRGVYLRNLYQSYIDVNEICYFQKGMEEAGDSAGAPMRGAQYNEIHFKQIFWNWCQIMINTYKVPSGGGTASNFANESYWYGGQLGRGVPSSNNYNNGGWYGMIVTKDTSSNAGSNAISGHMLYNINFEGLQFGLVMDHTSDNTFYSPSFEPYALTYHIMLDTNNCHNTKLLGNTYYYDYFFANGQIGHKTTIELTKFWASGTAGGSVIAGSRAVALPTGDVNSIIGIKGNKWLLSEDYYQGFTAWNSLSYDHDLYAKISKYPTVEGGALKLDSVDRYFGYHGRYKFISSTSPDTVQLQANIGDVRINSNRAHVLKVWFQDLIGPHAETFKLELQSATPVTVINSKTGAVLIAASIFNATPGKYECEYRSGQYAVTRYDRNNSTGSGTGTGTTYTAAPLGAGDDNGITVDNTNAQIRLHPATATQPGVVAPGNQNFGAGGKQFDSVASRILTLQNTGGLKIDMVGRVNGFSINDINGTAGQSNAANFTNYNFGSGANKDIYFSFGKTNMTTVGMGTNGLDAIFATEKSTNGMSWRVGIGFANASFTAGTEYMHLFPTGNLRLQNGGTYTNDGNRLSVGGTMAVDNLLYLGDLASEPTGTNGAIYYNTTLGKFRAYQAGAWVDMIGTGTGGTGGGITAFVTPVSATGANGGDVVSGNPRLFYATNTGPGIISLSNQVMGAGSKTFGGQVILRASVAGSGGNNTAGLVFPDGGIPAVPQNGHMFRNGDNYYIGVANEWQQIATSKAVMALYNKRWLGDNIEVTVGGTGASTPQGARDNLLEGTWHQNGWDIETTDGSSHIAGLEAVPNNTVGTVEVSASAYDATTIDGFTRKYIVRYRKVNGVVTIFGGLTEFNSSESSMTSCNLTVAPYTSIISDQAVGISVTGIAGKTIEWRVVSVRINPEPTPGT